MSKADRQRVKRQCKRYDILVNRTKSNWYDAGEAAHVNYAGDIDWYMRQKGYLARRHKKIRPRHCPGCGAGLRNNCLPNCQITFETIRRITS